MDTKQILTDLRIERERIDRAIAALEGLDGSHIRDACRATGMAADLGLNTVSRRSPPWQYPRRSSQRTVELPARLIIPRDFLPVQT